jgi:hypothetical protein
MRNQQASSKHLAKALVRGETALLAFLIGKRHATHLATLVAV